jgi:glycosyltransferase involved in cell wall biosynthesis
VTATPGIAARFSANVRPVIVVQNFPSSDDFASSEHRHWTERSLAVAYVGAISESRGVVEMIEAVSRLPVKLPATLELAGTWSPPALRESVASRPGWHRVADRGFQDRRGVATLLSRVRAGLVVLHREPNYESSYPTKMFEYMSAAIPVIASDFPLWRRIVEDARCGLVVDPKNPAAIADAIAYLLTHDQEAEAMGHAGREAVRERYDWAPEARKLVDLYRDLARPSRAVSEQRVRDTR